MRSPGQPSLLDVAAAPPDARLAAYGSSPSGLDPAEAARRLRLCGPNEPVPPQRSRTVFTFLANFTHTLALLLWFAAGLAFAASIPELGAAIVAVIAVNGVFAFVQEYRAERVVSSLMRRVAVQARVVRSGTEQRVVAADLVPGDVVRLAAGDIVPADCALLHADNLALDLSMLTGESLPVERSAEPAPVPPNAHEPQPSDLACFAPAGSGVVTGSAEAVVSSTGPASTLGSIAALVEGVHRGRSVLESQVAELSRLTAVLAVLAGTATLSVAAVSTNVEFIAALTFAVGVIVALVPEGLLPTLSVSLAVGAERMAARGAAVRRLSAVEAIGAVTVICSDKTGTLTENTLSVLGFVAPDGDGAAPDALLAAMLCNDARASANGFEGDALDVALARWAAAAGRDIESERRTWTRVSSVPFDAHRRYMSVVCRDGTAEREFIKGAPEAVLAMSGDHEPAPAVARAMAEATERGERVLMFAERRNGTLGILGLVRFFDPPRPEVPAAIAACRRARIRVIMLTGDHPGTARALARTVGLGDGSLAVIDGDSVDALSDAQLLSRLRSDAVFARIDPRQKLRITTLLRRAGEIVVVTGDGVNDAPALRAADVGVAMGRRGTEVAKQAADVVLADDNFATIVAAIEEGRSIKANIRRFASYVFTSNVAELAPFLFFIFLNVPLPLAVAQVLAIDLGTDLLPALALGTEPPSARTMDAPPEPPTRPLLTLPLAFKTFLFFGVIEAALGLAGFFAVYLVEGWRPFGSLAPFESVTRDARAATFLGIVAGQIGCLFAQRDGGFRHRLSLLTNRWIVPGLAFELALAFVLIYVPGLNRMFSMAAINPAWLLILPAGAAVFFLFDHLRRTLARVAARP
jgi:sodium/potassium-transporting ATPase subunit alpha